MSPLHQSSHPLYLLFNLMPSHPPTPALSPLHPSDPSYQSFQPLHQLSHLPQSLHQPSHPKLYMFFHLFALRLLTLDLTPLVPTLTPLYQPLHPSHQMLLLFQPCTLCTLYTSPFTLCTSLQPFTPFTLAFAPLGPLIHRCYLFEVPIANDVVCPMHHYFYLHHSQDAKGVRAVKTRIFGSHQS